MKVSQAKIIDLWKLRAAFYSNKKQGLLNAFLIPPLLLFIGPIVLSKFDEAVIGYSALGYSFYLVFVLIIIYELKMIKRKKLHDQYRQNVIILLKSMHDLGFLAMVFASFWTMAVILAYEIYSPHSISRISFLFLFISIGLMVLISPKVLNYKSSDRPEKGNKYLPLALALSGAAPGIGMLVYFFSSKSGNIGFQHAFFIIGSLFVSIGILPILIINFYEIMVLTFNKWPPLRKSGSTIELVE